MGLAVYLVVALASVEVNWARVAEGASRGLNFLAAFPDAARDWEGECYVFDKRIAIDTHRQETATTAEDVYGDDPAEAWRLARAKRLDPKG